MFTLAEYNVLHSHAFRDGYAGYKPEVKELPNGDGKVDADKKYSHIATKYIRTIEERRDLMPFLARAHHLATEAAQLLNIPPEFMPDINYGALRVLDYPPGAGSAKHKDFSLFTLMLYRDQPDKFVAEHVDVPALVKIRDLNAQAHLGEIAEEIGLGLATPHEVLPSETQQQSIVYFAIPDHKTLMPSGKNVRDWLNERMARSRTTFDEYK